VPNVPGGYSVPAGQIYDVGAGGIPNNPLSPKTTEKADTRLEKPEMSQYLETVYGSMQNMDPEARSEYLQTTMASIKDRLDQYEFRLARGVPLTPEQQSRYNSLRESYNDIQRYINNPDVYDQYFKAIAERGPGISGMYRDRAVGYARKA
jgi:hypothetical protein